MWVRNFLRFLRDSDSFGHPVQVAYKGRETFNTYLGAFMSLIVKGLTLVLLANAALEVYLMEDPLITVYNRGLTKEQKAEMIPLSFSDYNYTIAYKFEYSLPPPEIAILFATLTNESRAEFITKPHPKELKQIEWVNCT